MSEHILIIEDDLDIANIERDYLMVAAVSSNTIIVLEIQLREKQVLLKTIPMDGLSEWCQI